MSYIQASIFTSIPKEVLMNNFGNISLILKVSKPKHIFMSRATSLSVILTSWTLQEALEAAKGCLTHKTYPIKSLHATGTCLQIFNVHGVEAEIKSHKSLGWKQPDKGCGKQTQKKYFEILRTRYLGTLPKRECTTLIFIHEVQTSLNIGRGDFHVISVNVYTYGKAIYQLIFVLKIEEN